MSAFTVFDDSSSLQESGWIARLSLGFEHVNDKPVLLENVHEGPLRVQRAFHEDDGSCHAYLLHPPGGCVGGDQLLIDIRCGRSCHVVATSPSAGKFYRSQSRDLRQIQRNRISVEADATMEWLPLETIFFRGAQAHIQTDIELDARASYMGWDIACLGRSAAGEVFDDGTVTQRMSISRAGRLIHQERIHINAGVPMRNRGWGLADQPVYGTLVAVGKSASKTSRNKGNIVDAGLVLLIDSIRACLKRRKHTGLWGVSQKHGVILVRYLGGANEACRTGFIEIRDIISQHQRNITPARPRIWFT